MIFPSGVTYKPVAMTHSIVQHSILFNRGVVPANQSRIPALVLRQSVRGLHMDAAIAGAVPIFGPMNMIAITPAAFASIAVRPARTPRAAI